jgi:hypothetical protein
MVYLPQRTRQSPDPCYLLSDFLISLASAAISSLSRAGLLGGTHHLIILFPRSTPLSTGARLSFPHGSQVSHSTYITSYS